jgi:ABC-2 type transport system ATP-binding protein
LENIRFYGGIYGMTNIHIKSKSEELITQLGLESEAKKLVKSLPLGWKQKLAFSVAIFHEPKIVFLDEPTGGVDPVTRRQFWDLIYAASDQWNYGFCYHTLHGRSRILQPDFDDG